NDGNVTVSLQNSGSQDRTLDRARIAFFNPSNSNSNPPEYGDLNGNASDRLTFGDPYESIDAVTINAGQTVDVYVEFDVTGNWKITRGDFFILSIIYEDGETADYFVSVP
ncbi:MAG TPA: hypothetical protein VKA37_07530, partial [Halobacteriales archaeon]|nr:hypothetical protein [Halobacteriales archaeon]